jgi:hypothetical protein
MRRSGSLFASIALTPAIALPLSAAYQCLRYPGFSRSLINQVRFATPRENRNLWFCLGYWLEFVQKLRPDQATGAYNFNRTLTKALSDYEKGRIEYHRGAFRKSLSLFESAIHSRGESEARLFWLGLTYLKLAENENCLPMLRGDEHLEHVPDSVGMCPLPVTAFHRKTESAQAAAVIFQKLPDLYDPRNRLYQWLLNFNYMTLGRFPEGVPEKYWIRTPFIDRFYGEGKARAQAEFADLAFEDQAKQLGVNTFQAGRGVAIEDFDGDGYVDLVVCGSYEPVHFYHNDGRRGFVDKTAESGLGGVSQVFQIVPVDYDHDGHMDLFIGRPVPMAGLGDGGNGYASQSMWRVHFGIGNASKIDAVEVLWPSGKKEKITPVAINAVNHLVEGRGIVP